MYPILAHSDVVPILILLGINLLWSIPLIAFYIYGKTHTSTVINIVLCIPAIIINSAVNMNDPEYFGNMIFNYLPILYFVGIGLHIRKINNIQKTDN